MQLTALLDFLQATFLGWVAAIAAILAAVDVHAGALDLLDQRLVVLQLAAAAALLDRQPTLTPQSATAFLQDLVVHAGLEVEVDCSFGKGAGGERFVLEKCYVVLLLGEERC